MAKKRKIEQSSNAVSSVIDSNADRNGFSLFKLDFGKRFYLLVSRLDLNDAVLIYTLGCDGNANFYEMRATEDVMAFDDSKKADLYYETINNAIEDNKKTELYDIALLHNRSLAKRFEKRK